LTGGLSTYTIGIQPLVKLGLTSKRKVGTNAIEKKISILYLATLAVKPIEGKSFIVNSKVEDEIWIYHESPMDCANAVFPTRIRTKILNGRAYGRV
jgi:hypothetical protein